MHVIPCSACSFSPSPPPEADADRIMDDRALALPPPPRASFGSPPRAPTSTVERAEVHAIVGGAWHGSAARSR